MAIDDLINEFERHCPTCIDHSGSIIPILKPSDPTLYCSMPEYICDYKKEQGTNYICSFMQAQSLYFAILDKNDHIS